MNEKTSALFRAQYGAETFFEVQFLQGRCKMSHCTRRYDGDGKGKVVLYITQTWNSNCPRLFRHRLCKYSTFV